MRAMCLIAVAVLAAGLTGCGSGGSEAEKTIKDTITAMNSMADAIRAGNVAGVKSAAAQLKTLKDKAQTLKATASEDKRLQEKYEAELKKAGENVKAAATEGMMKFKPDELKEVLEAMTSLK